MELTFKDANGGWEVVDTACSLQGSNEHRWGWDEIVRESIVEVTLRGSISLHPVTPHVTPRIQLNIPEAQRHPGRCRTPSRI